MPANLPTSPSSFTTQPVLTQSPPPSYLPNFSFHRIFGEMGFCLVPSLHLYMKQDLNPPPHVTTQMTLSLLDRFGSVALRITERSPTQLILIKEPWKQFSKQTKKKHQSSPAKEQACSSREPVGTATPHAGLGSWQDPARSAQS